MVCALNDHTFDGRTMTRRFVVTVILLLVCGCGDQKRIVIRDGDVPVDKKNSDKSQNGTKKTSPLAKSSQSAANPKKKEAKAPAKAKKQTKPDELDDRPTKPLTFDPNEEAPTIVRPLSLTHVKPARTKPATKRANKTPAALPSPQRTLTAIEQQLVGTWVSQPAIPTDKQLDQFLTSTGVSGDELAEARKRAKQTIKKSSTTLLVRPDGTLKQVDKVAGRPSVEQDGVWKLAGSAVGKANLELGILAGTDADTGQTVMDRVKVAVDLIATDKILWKLPPGMVPFPKGMEFRRTKSTEHLRLIAADDPKSVASLKQLRVQIDQGVKGEIIGLTLSAEAIRAAGPYLAGLRNVRRLHIGFGSVSQVLPIIGKMRSLRELFLDASGLSDSQLGPLVGLEELERLSVRGNPISDKGLATIAKIVSLRRLVLHSTKVTDAGLPQLATLKRLDSLDISSTQTSGIGLAALQKLPFFMHLAVAATHVDAPGLTAIGKLTKLRSLSLVKCGKVSDESLSALANLTNLQEIWIGQTEVTGVGLTKLGKLPLSSIHAGQSKFNDQGMAQLAKCLKLRSLALDSTQVTDAGLIHLKNLKSLRVISLAGNKINGSGLSHLGSLSKLEMLQLANTQTSDASLGTLRSVSIQVLGLAGTPVSNQSVAALIQLKKLRLVELQGSQVDDAGKQKLKTARPKLQIR